jgi:hypothetical protein
MQPMHGSAADSNGTRRRLRRCLRVAVASLLLSGATAVAQQTAAPLKQPALPDSPLDPKVAGQQIQRELARAFLHCRPGGDMTVDVIHLDSATSTAPADAAWLVKVTLKAAPAGTSTRPLQPGECAYVDRPPPSDKAVVLWRPLRTVGTRAQRNPTDGLQAITTSQQWGYIYTDSVDSVFDSVFDRFFRQRAPGGRAFRLRVEPLACDRNCGRFVANPWDFHVLETLAN